jgi:hypothetical protein
MQIRARISDVRLLLRSGAPLPVVGIYCKRLLLKLLAVLSSNHSHVSSDLMTPIDSDGTFTTRWFDCNAKEWMKVFESERLFEKRVDILEIGSWEGRSTSFFLHYLKSAFVTAVDTWQGGDDHVHYTQLAQIESVFDRNVARFGDRVTKVKATSFEYFGKQDPKRLFDVIYVDGSHRADDVMIDALQSFIALKPGGILIFDDYTWLCYKTMRRNPAFAINCFLKMKQGEYTVLSVTGQLYIKKRSSDDSLIDAAA